MTDDRRNGAASFRSPPRPPRRPDRARHPRPDRRALDRPQRQGRRPVARRRRRLVHRDAGAGQRPAPGRPGPWLPSTAVGPRTSTQRALPGFSFEGSADGAARLARDPKVRSVVPDRRVGTTAQAVPTGVRRIDGPLSGTVSGNGGGRGRRRHRRHRHRHRSRPPRPQRGRRRELLDRAPATTTTTATARTWPARRPPKTTAPASSASPPAPACGPYGSSTTPVRAAGRR